MKSNQYKSLIYKFSIIGGVLGFGFLFLFVGFDFYFKNLTISISAILSYHTDNPSIWLADILPFVLIFYGYKIGKNLAEKEENSRNQVENEIQKTR